MEIKNQKERVKRLESEIIVMYNNGNCRSKIAKRLGIAKLTVNRVLLRNGLKLIDQSFRTDINDKEIEVIKLYEEGMSMNKIMHKMNCTYCVIKRLLNKNNISLRPKKNYIDKKRKDIYDKKNEVIDYYKKGLSMMNISKIMKCDFEVIKTILVNNGCEIRKQGHYLKGKIPKNKLFLNEENVLDMYINKDMTGLEIAEIFNCDCSVIYNILHKNKIKVGKRLYSEDMVNAIIKEYLSSTLSGKDVAKKLNYKMGTVYNLLNKHKIKLKGQKYSLKGEKSHAWLGGKSFEPYGLEFNNTFRNKIRQRDNQVCMNCGKHREQLKKALHIHHVNYEKTLNIKENVIALCSSCHMITNFNREYWTKLFQDKLSHLYGYTYEEGKIKVNLNNYLNEINKENVEDNLRKAQDEANRLNEAIKK